MPVRARVERVTQACKRAARGSDALSRCPPPPQALLEGVEGLQWLAERCRCSAVLPAEIPLRLRGACPSRDVGGWPTPPAPARVVLGVQSVRTGRGAPPPRGFPPRPS
eukprot:scaffold187598_cov30-Tisochrysis_lutea.AAC.6